MIEYKCKLIGIQVILTEESYTSKCSFVDFEEIRKNEVYLGKRKHRGLFISKDGIKINADCNGSGNIIRKEFPNAFADGIEGVVVRPLRITPYKKVA
jgi:putative transposase